jgi:hypothetical protein
LFGEEEWYFFTPRDRKYPKGLRPNRAAGAGYWKATGTDKPILTSCGLKSIGVKKALVFYKGRPPKGSKTDWIMNEYRLHDSMISNSKHSGSMRVGQFREFNFSSFKIYKTLTHTQTRTEHNTDTSTSTKETLTRLRHGFNMKFQCYI